MPDQQSDWKQSGTIRARVRFNPSSPKVRVMPAGFENKKSKTKASLTPFIDSFEITTQFQEYFTQIKDPRVERTRYHLLTDIIIITILAVIAGASGWEDIEEYGISK